VVELQPLGQDRDHSISTGARLILIVSAMVGASVEVQRALTIGSS